MAMLRGTLRVPQGLTVEWKIQDYFDLKDEEIYSPDFSFADATWCLNIDPHGSACDNTVGWTCLYLKKESSSSKKHLIQFMLGIKRADGSVFYSCDDIHEFEDIGYGSEKELRPSKLLESKSVLAPDNTLRIFCILHLVDDIPEEKSSQTSPLKNTHLETLSENLTDLCLGGSHSDVTIKVKDQEFHVHRSMLSARSKVFASMFAYDTAENLNQEVNIEDCDPGAFKKFLHFLYTGKVDSASCGDACELYKIADKYDLQGLKEDCVERMSDGICVDAFCDITLTALMHNESELLETATKFFIKNTKDIFRSLEWQLFLKNHTTSANELLIKLSDSI